ncbi:MAG TPA: septum formation protein Maf [Caldithrix abyssi]|uniref:dTTP/UTP pyrophosphatase n=1 Tax=Caldithrix abyssi TaxID=187145 RepID=A0A7V5UFS1_CALAY|nr:septum formation protein Maf [Caldithrix abyssi]
MLFSLIENLDKIDIVLASASPRRFELLKNIGLNFRVEVSDVAENHPDIKEPTELALYNARIKGRAVANKYPESLIISADTIVVLDNHLMGKPANEQEAYRMLKTLSARTHKVITAFGLHLLKYEKEHYDWVATDVTFRPLTDEEIWAYINTAEPMDKAGAYGIQGQGAILIEKISGCYYNVVGFPLSRFYEALGNFLSPFVW